MLNDDTSKLHDSENSNSCKAQMLLDVPQNHHTCAPPCTSSERQTFTCSWLTVSSWGSWWSTYLISYLHSKSDRNAADWPAWLKNRLPSKKRSNSLGEDGCNRCWLIGSVDDIHLASLIMQNTFRMRVPFQFSRTLVDEDCVANNMTMAQRNALASVGDDACHPNAMQTAIVRAMRPTWSLMLHDA